VAATTPTVQPDPAISFNTKLYTGVIVGPMKQTGTLWLSILFASTIATELLSANAAIPVARRALLSIALTPEKAVSRVEIKEVTLGPNQKAPLHLHPGPVVGLITAGEITFQIEGEAAQHLKTGDAFYEPANQRITHFDNDHAEPAKFAAFYLLGQDDHELIRLIAP